MQPLKKEPMKKAPDTQTYAVKWKEAMRKLYACASPKYKGQIQNIEFRMCKGLVLRFYKNL